MEMGESIAIPNPMLFQIVKRIRVFFISQRPSIMHFFEHTIVYYWGSLLKKIINHRRILL